MSGSPWILFQSVQPRIGCYSTSLTFQTMSEPFQIFLKYSNVQISGNKMLYMPSDVWIKLYIISIGKIPNRMLFNPTDIPNNVRTIPNNFKKLKCPNWGAINCYTCQMMFGSSWILFRLVQPQIGCYSTSLTFQTMSEPFQIILKYSNVRIGGNKLLYMPNDVWIKLNIISIGKTPNRSLFNPTGIPDNVRTIPNIF